MSPHTIQLAQIPSPLWDGSQVMKQYEGLVRGMRGMSALEASKPYFSVCTSKFVAPYTARHLMRKILISFILCLKRWKGRFPGKLPVRKVVKILYLTFPLKYWQFNC